MVKRIHYMGEVTMLSKERALTTSTDYVLPR